MMSHGKSNVSALRPSSRSESRNLRRECDELSYSTASSTSQLVRIADYSVDGPVLRVFSSSSEAADTRNTDDTVDGSTLKRRVAVQVYDGSESDSSGSSASSDSGNTSGSATRSSATSSIGSEVARVDSRSIISPPNQIKRQVNSQVISRRQVQHPTIADPKISFFGSMFSCFTPEESNEINVEHAASSRAVPNGDVLDNVFGTVESCVCADTTSLDPKNRDVLAQGYENNYKQRDILDNVFEGVERRVCAEDTTQDRKMVPSSSRLKSEKRMRDMANTKARALAKYERDMLDSVFDGVERVACNEHPTTYDKYDSYVPTNKDMFDYVFEGIEGIACRDDTEFSYGQQRTIRRLRGQDPPGKTKKTSRALVKQENDTLDYVCGNFEHAVCLGNTNSMHRRETDVLDSVCESVELAACRDSARAGGSDLPIDLTTVSGFSLENQNSIVDPLRDYEEVERRAALQRMRERGRRGATSRNSDVIDRVFENLESKICYNDQHRRVQVGGGKRVKKSNLEHQEDLGKNQRVYYVQAGE